MKPITFSSLGARLALLILLAMLLVLGLTYYTYLQERRLVTTHLEDDIQRIVGIAANDQEHLIYRTRQFLAALVRLPEVRLPDRTSCSTLLAGFLDEYPRYANLGVVGLDGGLLCSAAQTNDIVSYADEPWFKRTVESNDFAMGACVTAPATGKSTLNISYPVVDENGGARAVVFAALDLNQIGELISQARLPHGAEFILLAQNGNILACHPDPENLIGKSLKQVPIIDEVLRSGQGVAELNGLDGVLRLYAFAPLCTTVDTGLYVAIGFPVSSVYSAATGVLLRHFAGLGVVTLLALSLVWFGSNALILRPVNILVGAARRLSQGDMKVRTGLPHGAGDLDRLARAFDDMAQALEEQEIQLREAEAKYRALVEQTPVITYTARLDGARKATYISPRIQEMLGFTPEDWTNDPELWRKQIHSDDLAQVQATLAGCRANYESLDCEYRIFSKDGRILWFHDEASLLAGKDCDYLYLQGILRDVTEQRMAKEKLAQYQNQLRSLASQLSLAEERERRRIATDLHDSVGQALAMSKIKLGALKHSAPSAEFAEAIEEVRGFIVQAIQDTRSLIFKISSPILYELGLEAALEWLAEQVQKQHGITVDLRDDKQAKPLDNDIRILLFQAAGELLVNVVKHARARRAVLSIERDAKNIRVSVEDDGVGFNTAEKDSRWSSTDGFGLFSIRERLNHVRGCLEIESQPGEGTRVTLVAPLKTT